MHTFTKDITPELIEEFNRRFYIDSDWKLRNKIKYCMKVNIGDEAGCLHKASGYRSVVIQGENHRTHRVIWCMHYNTQPKNDLDHIDKNKLNNNPINNLREVTHQENCKNRPKRSNNTSGITGVSWNTAIQKWKVYIKLSGKDKHLGYFTTKLAAANARHAAELKYGFTND